MAMRIAFVDYFKNFYASARDGIHSANAVMRGVQHISTEQPPIICLKLSITDKFTGLLPFLEEPNTLKLVNEMKVYSKLTCQSMHYVSEQIIKYASDAKSGYLVLPSDQGYGGYPAGVMLVRSDVYAQSQHRRNNLILT